MLKELRERFDLDEILEMKYTSISILEYNL